MSIVNRLVLVALMLPRAVSLLIEFVQHVIQRMSNNAWFPSPDPTIAQLSAALEALVLAQTASRSRAKGLIEVRNEKVRVVRGIMREMRAYVQKVANANPAEAKAIIESAGMFVKKATTRTGSEFEAKHGKNSGEVLLISKRVGKHASYEWQFGTDQKTWTNAPTTLRSRTVIRGLTPVVTYYFRRRIVTKAGEGDWSQVVSLIVI